MCQVDLDVHQWAYLARKVRLSSRRGCICWHQPFMRASAEATRTPEHLLVTQAFGGFINRLSTVIFENALVIQGNR